MQKTSKDINEIVQIDPELIIIPEDRVRKEFDPEDLRKLAESIKKRRQDTPGICRLGEDGQIILVAGERRLRACKLAGVPFSYHLTSSTDSLEILEIEYEENVYRVNLSWYEEEKAFVRLQDLKQQLYGEAKRGAVGGWGIRDTANLAGVSIGKVHEALELSAYADSFDEVKSAKTKREAKKIVESIKNIHKRNELLNDMVNQEGAKETISGQETFREAFMKNTQRILLGDMAEVLSSDSTMYSVVLFDPAWGVEYDDVGKLAPGQKTYKDSVEYMQINLPRWLKIIYDRMTKDSHLYMFFGIVNFTFIYQTLDQIGFETNRMPIIWHKIGAHRIRNAELWPGHSYEPIAFARKGKRNLIKLGAGDIISTKMLPPGKKDIHSSAKHPAVYLELLQRSALPGDNILDPMCGSGMSGVACDVLDTTHKLKYKGIELDSDFRNLALENLIRGYYKITEEENITQKEE